MTLRDSVISSMEQTSINTTTDSGDTVENLKTQDDNTNSTTGKNDVKEELSVEPNNTTDEVVAASISKPAISSTEQTSSNSTTDAIDTAENSNTPEDNTNSLMSKNEVKEESSAQPSTTSDEVAPPKRKRKRPSMWGDAPAAKTLNPAAPVVQSENLLAAALHQRLQATALSSSSSASSVGIMMPPAHHVMPTAGTNVANRLYIGNLNYDVSPEYVTTIFQSFGHIVNVSMPREGMRSKGFCFLEYDNALSAVNALNSMNGFNVNGRSLRVGRPTVNQSMQRQGIQPLPLQFAQQQAQQHAHVQQQAQAAAYAAAQATATSGGRGPTKLGPAENRIYVGSIAFNLNAEHLKQVFASFGNIISCELIPNHETGSHKGYGFIEYTNKESAVSACTQMNGFSLMGRALKVGPSLSGTSGTSANVSLMHTSTPTMGVAGAAAAAAILSAGSAGGAIGATAIADESSLSREEDLTIKKSDRESLMRSLARPRCSSRAIVLLNMFDPNKDPDNDVEDETHEECSQYGVVKKVMVMSGRHARVFVLFEDIEGATKALSELDGRWFGGRKVEALSQNDLSIFTPSEDVAETTT